MESPNPSPSGKRKRSPGPPGAIPAPPTRAANDDNSSETEMNTMMMIVHDLLKKDPASAEVLNIFKDLAYRAAKSDVEREVCKSILDSDSPKVLLNYSPRLSVDNKERGSFLKAFDEEYKDDRSCLETFTTFIDRCATEWERGSYLAPYTSLVQSSGTGKSRLVKEFANRRYVMYCCVRKRGSSGIPARSWIADKLVPTAIAGDEHERLKGFLLYASFFCACMLRLADSVKSDASVTEREWCKMQLVEEELVEEESGQTNNVSGVAFWKEIHERMTVFRTTVLKERTYEDGLAFVELLETKIQSSYTELRESFSTPGVDRKGKALLTFALDESRSLLGKYGATTHFSILRWMASSLGERCGIFIVLLDTTSKISNFMPPQIPDTSFRYSGKSTQPLPPFYAVDTFDILAPKEKIWTVLGDSHCDLTSVLLKHFMKGRPLFGSYIQSGSDGKDSAVVRLADVVRLAVAKLLGGIAVQQNMQVITDQCLAVALLSVRAAVFVKPQSDLASSLVSKHLGMCLAISSDRRSVFVGYPSEPVLAEAACHIMNRRSELDLGDLLGPMLPYVREGIVEGGARGELVARILFLLAWDRACKNDTSEYEPRFTIFRDVLYTRPLVVREFLHSLADKDQFDKALEGQIDQKQMERFLKGRVFFTHFTSVTRSVQRSELIDFYERGVAILCKRNQAAVDMIIPVRLCEDEMSCILVQVRNYTHGDGNYKWASLDVRPQCAGLSEDPANYPYLALYLQFGYKIGKVYNLKYEKHDVAAPDAIPSARREAKPSDEDPFQMIIGLFSLKPAAYPCLRDEVSRDYGATEDSKNSEHLSSFCQAWSDPLCYVESNEPTALGESTIKKAKCDFVKHTCVLTYASSSSGS